MANELGSPSFEEIFRFRAPRKEEADNAVEDMNNKTELHGDPIGTIAFFSAPGVKKASLEFIGLTAMNFAEDYDIPVEQAKTIVYAGFIGALEILASISLRIED